MGGGQSREAHVSLAGSLTPPQPGGEGEKQLSHEILVSGESQAELEVTDLILGARPVEPLLVIEDALFRSEDRLFFSKCIRLSPDLWSSSREIVLYSGEH